MSTAFGPRLYHISDTLCRKGKVLETILMLFFNIWRSLPHSMLCVFILMLSLIVKAKPRRARIDFPTFCATRPPANTLSAMNRICGQPIGSQHCLIGDYGRHVLCQCGNCNDLVVIKTVTIRGSTYWYLYGRLRARF